MREKQVWIILDGADPATVNTDQNHHAGLNPENEYQILSKYKHTHRGEIFPSKGS